MKKIFFLLAFATISLFTYSQSTVLLRGDTIKVYKQGDTATLKVEGEVMITHYKLGSATDSVLMWDPVSKKVRMRNAGSLGVNIYNSDGILTGNRTLTGLNNTYSLNFDSLNSWRVQRNGITRFSMSSSTSSMIGPNTNAAFTANTSQAIVNYQANALRVAVDSSTITKILSYETNINGSLTPNAHATKSYVDSVAAASGTTPTLQQVFNKEVGGSVLTKNDSIITQSGNHFLTVQGNGTSTTIPTFEVKNTGSNGLAMQIVSSGKGLYINGASGGQTALEADGYSTGFTAQLTANANGTVLYMNKYSSTTNAVATIAATQINRFISGGGTAAAGVGFFEDKSIQTTSGSASSAVQHHYLLTTATGGAQTAQYFIKQANAGTLLNTYFQNSGRTDTVATLYDVRAGGGSLPDSSVALDPSFSTNKRLQKIIDSLMLVKYNFSSLSNYDILRYNASGTEFVNTNKLENLRWIPRQDSATSSATPTINTDNVDIFKITALAADITSMTTNLSGTPRHGEILEIQITATATRAITWGSAFVSSSVALPTTTSTTTTLTVILQYYTNSSYGNFKWVCVNYY